MKLTDKTIIRIFGVAIGIVAVAGAAYAATSTISDKPKEVTTAIAATTEQPFSGVPNPEQEATAATSLVSATAPLSTEKETTVAINTTKASKEITFEYDPELSREIGRLIEAAHNGEWVYVHTENLRSHPENLIHGTEVSKINTSQWFVGEISGNDPAQGIMNAWTNFDPLNVGNRPRNFQVEAFKYSNGYYYVVV